MKIMKIALVVHDVSKERGHDRYVAELANTLADEHEVHIFANTCKDVDLSKIQFHFVWSITKPTLLKILTFLIAATLKLRGHRFDVIHAQGVCGLIQDVVTAHTCQCAWQREYRKLPRHSLWQYLYHLMVTKICAVLEQYIYQSRHSKHLIAISGQIKREISQCYGRDEKDITTIYHGINLSEFHPENCKKYRAAIRKRHNIPKDCFVLLFVGEFRRKGLEYVIRALPYLDKGKKERVPNLLLLVVGADRTEPYIQLSRALAVDDSLLFIGHTDTINQYYAASDVLVFPTLYEPFGFAITEAMATGMPVITSKSAGAAELIHHGIDGLLLENPKRADEIAANIQLLLDDEELRISIGENARKQVAKYTWGENAQTVLKVYDNVWRGQS